MKCSTLAASLAAVGLMAFSALGDGESQAYGVENFTGYEVGAKVSELGTGPLGTWSAGEADKSEIANDGAGKYLKLNTEGDVVTNAFTQAEAINGALAGDTNVVISANVAFVPSDELEDFSNAGADLKFALYAYEQELVEEQKDADTGDVTNTVPYMVTNLVVYHAFGSPKQLINEVVEAPASFTTRPLVAHYIWTTMKKLGDNLYFKVAVDDAASFLTAPNASSDAELSIGTGTDRVWFQTVNDDSNNEVSSLNFSGTGAINELSAGYEAPAVVEDVTVEWTADENLEAYKDKSLTKPITKASYTEQPKEKIYFTIALGKEADFHIEGTDLVFLDDDHTTASYTMSTNATLDIRAVANEEPAKPTVITIANVGGKGTFAIEPTNPMSGDTVTATLSDIAEGFKAFAFVDGEIVELNEDGQFSFTAGLTNDLAVTYAKESAWYMDPFKRVENKVYKKDAYTPMRGLMSEDGTYYVFGAGPNNYDSDCFGGYVNKIADLTTTLNPDFTWFRHNDGQYMSDQETFRDIAFSSVNNMMVSPARVAANPYAVAYPLDGDWEGANDARYNIPNDLGLPAFPAAFGVSGEYYYGRVIGGDWNNYTCQFKIIKDENGKITNLETNKFWQTGGAVAIHVYQKDGHDIVYVALGPSIKVFDTTSDEVKDITIPGCGTIWSVGISGRADGVLHMTLNTGSMGLCVFALNDDMMSLASTTPIASFNAAQLGLNQQTYSAPGVLDDESMLFMPASNPGNKVSFTVYQKRPANLIVRGTFSDEENAEDDVSVVYGAATNVAFTAPKGFQITAVKVNGVADANFTPAAYTFTSAALSNNVYVAMTVEALPVAMIGATGYPTLAAAATAAVDNDTIILLDDYALAADEKVVFTNKVVTLDLGDNSLTIRGDNKDFIIATDSDVTLTNGVIAGTAAYGIKVDGTLTVADIDMDANGAGPCFDMYANASVTVNSGSFLNFHDVFRLTKVDNAKPTVVVNGGTFSSTQYGAFYAYKAGCEADITINDGTFETQFIFVNKDKSSDFTWTGDKLDDTCKAKFKVIAQHETSLFKLGDFVADGYALVKGEDNYYTIQKAYAITITAPENGTLETSVTNNIVAGTEVTVTATPAANYELESITTNGTAITGTTFVMPAENVTVAATFKSTGQTYPPTWPEESTYTEAFGVWAGNYDLTGVDLTTDAAQNAFLMNADPNGTLPTLKIESIAVADGVATIVVSAEGKDLETGINGVLYVSGCNALGGEWVTTVVDATADSFTDGKATFTVEGAQFMKAKIGFKAETPAN